MPIHVVRSLATAITRQVGLRDPLTIVFVGKQTMARLNDATRGHAEPTDVLSFSYAAVGKSVFKTGPEVAARGELFLCMPVITARAKIHSEAVHLALRRTVIHGILHLIGYTHDTAPTKIKMRRVEDRLLHSSHASL